jgi:hypothetical protein
MRPTLSEPSIEPRLSMADTGSEGTIGYGSSESSGAQCEPLMWAPSIDEEGIARDIAAVLGGEE